MMTLDEAVNTVLFQKTKKKRNGKPVMLMSAHAVKALRKYMSLAREIHTHDQIHTAAHIHMDLMGTGKVAPCEVMLAFFCAGVVIGIEMTKDPLNCAPGIDLGPSA